MSSNKIKTAKKRKQTNKDDTLASSECQTSSTEKLDEITSTGIHDQQQYLVEIANSTFQELTKTLENEQAKLIELEERRKRLQQEMLQLKAEIEKEKESYEINIVQSVAENLNLLNTKPNPLDTNEVSSSNSENCKINEIQATKDDEEVIMETVRKVGNKNCTELTNNDTTIDNKTPYIRSALQSVLTESEKP